MGLCAAMLLTEILTEDRVITGLAASSKQEALTAVSELFAGVQDLDAASVRNVLEERERLASTGVGSGVAIPHGRMAGLSELLAALAVSTGGIPFDAIDGQPVHILVVVLAPQRHTGDHLKVLAQVSRMLRQESVRRGLVDAVDAKSALTLIREVNGRA